MPISLDAQKLGRKWIGIDITHLSIAAIGVFTTLEAPSKDMITEAISAGYYESPGWNQKYPRIQILTIDDLLHNRTAVKMPSQHVTFKQAQKAQMSQGEQPELEIQ